jgi:hypothetical protein
VAKYHVVMQDGTDGVVEAKDGAEVWARGRGKVALVEEVEGEDYSGTRDADRAKAAAPVAKTAPASPAPKAEPEDRDEDSKE